MPQALRRAIFLVGLAIFWWIRLAHFWRKAHTKHQIALLGAVSISLTVLVFFLLGLGVFQGPMYLVKHLDLVGLGFAFALFLMIIGYPVGYFFGHTTVFTREYSERFRTSGTALQHVGVNKGVSDSQD